MSLSYQNKALLMRKLGKTDIPDGDAKITLTMNNLAKLLDAAREEGVEAGRDAAMIDAKHHAYRDSSHMKKDEKKTWWRP